MKTMGYILLLGSVFCLLGIVGSIEHGGMPLAEGIFKSMACLAVTVAGKVIINCYEEK